MSAETNFIRAAPLQPTTSSSNVAFITRTADDYRTAPPPQKLAAGSEFQQPCSLKGLSGGLAAGALGYVFGFVPSVFRNRNLKSLPLWGADGMASAQAFAVMSGIYTLVQCFCERLREADDGWNRAVAGCASGLAVGFKSGPLGAAQSCVALGGLSYILDAGTGGAAHAATPGAPSGSSCCSGGCNVGLGRYVTCSLAQGPTSASVGAAPPPRKGALHVRLGKAHALPRMARPADVLDVPVVMWLGPVFGGSYFNSPALQIG